MVVGALMPDLDESSWNNRYPQSSQADILFNSGNILAAAIKWLVHKAARRSRPAAEVTTMTRCVG
jgi:hypothetical protein